MSRRSAAKRFGVSAASAVRWVAAFSTTGGAEAKPQGGDTSSHRIGAFSGVILAAVAAQKDISLAELADLLRTGHGVSVGASSVWRCLDRHDMTVKKAAHAAEQERPDVEPGAERGLQPSLTSTLSAWCTSTKPAPRPRWPGCEAAPGQGNAAGPRYRTGTGRQPPLPGHFG